MRAPVGIPIFIAVVALAAGLGEPASGSTGTCEVHNVTQGTTYGPNKGAALEKAIAEAELDNVLEVAGSCDGEFSLDPADRLTVRGPRGQPRPVLSGYVDASDARLMRLTITGALSIYTRGTTTMSHVKIVRMSTSTCSFVLNNLGGDLVIKHAIIAHNNHAGAIHNGDHGHLTARDVRVVHNNNRCSSSFGGGIRNFRSKMFLDDVLVKNNSANYGGGGSNTGQMTITNSRIVDNTARLGIGGGIVNYKTLTVDGSDVIGNESRDQGGGIYNYKKATFTVTGSQVLRNVTGTAGGGIFNDEQGTATVTDTVVADNEPDDCVGVVC